MILVILIVAWLLVAALNISERVDLGLSHTTVSIVYTIKSMGKVCRLKHPLDDQKRKTVVSRKVESQNAHQSLR